MSAGTVGPDAALGSEAATLDGFRDNRFLVVAVACRRVMQLRSGARPRLDPGRHKHCVTAVAEVVAGTVPYHTS